MNYILFLCASSLLGFSDSLLLNNHHILYEKTADLKDISKKISNIAISSILILCIQHPSYAMDESGKLLGGAASTLMQVG